MLKLFEYNDIENNLYGIFIQDSRKIPCKNQKYFKREYNDRYYLFSWNYLTVISTNIKLINILIDKFGSFNIYGFNPFSVLDKYWRN